MEAAKFGGVAAKICQKILDVVFGIHAVWGNYLKIYFWLGNLLKKSNFSSAQAQGCQKRYKCCGNLESTAGCEKVCKKCSRPWGSSAQQCFVKGHNLVKTE